MTKICNLREKLHLLLFMIKLFRHFYVILFGFAWINFDRINVFINLRESETMLCKYVMQVNSTHILLEQKHFNSQFETLKHYHNIYLVIFYYYHWYTQKLCSN